jgi:hypothetical protein
MGVFLGKPGILDELTLPWPISKDYWPDSKSDVHIAEQYHLISRCIKCM